MMWSKISKFLSFREFAPTSKKRLQISYVPIKPYNLQNEEYMTDKHISILYQSVLSCYITNISIIV